MLTLNARCLLTCCPAVLSLCFLCPCASQTTKPLRKTCLRGSWQRRARLSKQHTAEEFFFLPNSRLNGTALLERRTYRNSPWRNTQWSEVLHNLYALDIHEKREIGETTRIGSKPNPKEGKRKREEQASGRYEARGRHDAHPACANQNQRSSSKESAYCHFYFFALYFFLSR